MNNNMPLRHLSIRVPWHDSGWSGVVCEAPHLNGACAKLKRIAGGKDDVVEKNLKAKSLDSLPTDQWPCCVAERAAFMAPFAMDQIRKHALATKNSAHYGHFQPTLQQYLAYSAGIVPFRWMMRKNMTTYRDLYELDVDEAREPDLGYQTNWVHEARNQRALLDGFSAHLQKEDSLCFFYAKHVPFIEGTGRILIGVGRIKGIGTLKEYDRDGEGMPGMVWERPIQHSIRPKGADGFLMPYYDLLNQAEENPSLDLERYTAKAPDEHWDEFSYASELVTHDGGIAALLALEAVLDRMEVDLGIPTEPQRQWINKELVRLWKVRGPFPGLGAVLSAFGLSRGIFVAHALQEKAGENADPWPLVDGLFESPDSVLPKELHKDIKELAPTWKGLPAQRKAFLRLLSRFELTKDQAKHLYEDGSRKKRGWNSTDQEILENPYRIFEISRHDPDGIHLLTVDRGVFPEDIVRTKHPLESPSGLDSALDLRRVRAFTIAALEDAARVGHTLLPKAKAVEAIESRPAQPPCPVTADMLTARVNDMKPEVVSVSMDDDLALQLERYAKIGDLVRDQVSRRIKGARHTIACDWAALLDAALQKKGVGPAQDDEDKRAREEKVAALTELAESRFSVLAGPAGAGKTTVLGVLCEAPAIQQDGILLLAPTGKARVRMQELAGTGGGNAMTIAQFLNKNGRYDGRTARYVMSDRPKAEGFGTVIVDESSMLTEDMLGALFDALTGVKRFILVGDPAQLPPIGAGRPFVDIIAKLRSEDVEPKFPRVVKSYAELTIERRQVGKKTADLAPGHAELTVESQSGGKERPDLRLARWFSATPPSAGEDDIFTCGAEEHSPIRFVEWDKPEDFQQKLIEVLVSELKLSGPDDLRGFNQALGANASGDYDYFNATRNGNVGSVAQVEAWQILSPLHSMPFGVSDINRQIHEKYRDGFLKLATQQWRSIPKPFGAERIVYGDKVINVSNHRRDGNRVYPQENALGYLANGEIGIATGMWKSRANPKILNVEFSSQQGFTYAFYESDFREEGDAALELAYALTVHKAQGSQFKLVILVLPKDHPILSRELVYTALTRHQDRVVVMHQGPRTTLKDFASPQRSETARRMTNLLLPCKMVEFPQAKGSLFFQEGLIHRTSTGIAVRSKSELIIFEALRHAGFSPAYEKPLTFGGSTRYPDFTIEDDATGQIVYWEHLGMMDKAEYRTSWQKKLAWYRENGILPAEEGSGENGMLITTEESGNNPFGADTVQARINDYLK